MTDNEALMTKKPKAPWDDTIKTVFYALLIALVFRSIFFEPFHIPSGSMKSNLLVGDYLFVSKYTYGYSRFSFPLGLPPFKDRVMELQQPKRGDVVVFRLPKNPSVDFIKRIMGMPGDTIQVKNAVVYINGKALPRTQVDMFTDDENPMHARAIPRIEETLPEGKKILVLQERTNGEENDTPLFTVPQGHYFMMGDNRDNSRDSRFQDEVGFVPKQNIVGRAEIIFVSTDGTAKWWEVWKWVPSLRFSRTLQLIR